MTAPLVLMMTSAPSTRRSCSSIDAGRSLYRSRSPYGSSLARCGEPSIWIGSSPGTTNLIRPFSAMTLTSLQNAYWFVGSGTSPVTAPGPTIQCGRRSLAGRGSAVVLGNAKDPGRGRLDLGDASTSPQVPHSVRRDTRRAPALVGLAVRHNSLGLRTRLSSKTLAASLELTIAWSRLLVFMMTCTSSALDFIVSIRGAHSSISASV